MIRPMPLEVSAGEEMVILENLPAFKRNGFHFRVDEDAPATKKRKKQVRPTPVLAPQLTNCPTH